MRIAVGQLWQETNTFNRLATTWADFEAFGIDEGDALVARMEQTNELGGFIQSLRSWPERPDIVGLVRLPAWPGGPITAECLEALMDRMSGALARALPLDGVLVALHGALVGATEGDVEGLLLDKVRRLVGAEVPIVATLDLHANVTRRMAANADALVIYHTAPHVDVMETGKRAAGVLRRILVDKVRPRMVLRKLPMVVPAEGANTQDPASISHSFRQRLEALEADERILAAGLATVQPWLDIPELGSAVVVVTADDLPLAEAVSLEVARTVWQHRRDYLVELVGVEEAVRRAHARADGLVVLGDAADATTSGSPGDSTAILAELIRYRWPRPALVTLVAPELVAEAERRGPGSAWEATVGGRRDTRFCAPLTLAVTVKKVFDARFVLTGHLAEKLPIDMGRCAVLTHGNVHIVATSRSGPHFAPALFETAGLDPFAASVVVAKSPCGFRAAYAARAGEIIMVSAPGCSPSDFWRYPYHNIPRPLWPWDEIDWPQDVG